MLDVCEKFVNKTAPRKPSDKHYVTIRPISEIIQENGILIAGADFGSSTSVRLPPFSLAIDGLFYERFEPVHDDLYRTLSLVPEEFEQWPRVALHAPASYKNGEGLECICEYVPLAAAICRRRTLRTEYDTPGLGEGLVEGVERSAP